MTATDPARLGDLLEDALTGWAAPARPLLAVFCAAENEITGALCARIRCDGNHDAGGESWADPTAPHADTRPDTEEI